MKNTKIYSTQKPQIASFQRTDNAHPQQRARPYTNGPKQKKTTKFAQRKGCLENGKPRRNLPHAQSWNNKFCMPSDGGLKER